MQIGKMTCKAHDALKAQNLSQSEHGLNHSELILTKWTIFSSKNSSKRYKR